MSETYEFELSNSNLNRQTPLSEALGSGLVVNRSARGSVSSASASLSLGSAQGSVLNSVVMADVPIGSTRGSVSGSARSSVSSSVFGSSSVAMAAVNQPVQNQADRVSSLSNSQVVKSSSSVFLSQIEQAILRSTVPIDVNETEEITVLGQRGIWANRAEVVNWRGEIPITQYIINEDANPEVITKRVSQSLEYVQELAIRYLRPPTPPAPGEIVIIKQENSLTAPAPPLVIRQQPARPDTPEPLVIREAPPQAPATVGRKVITITGKRIPPPPRKVVIERLAPLPAKPQSVLVERWLPYAQVKRRVVFQKAPGPDPVVVKPRNVIVQWEAPQVNIKKEIKYLGVVRANPVEYVQRYGASLKTAKDLPQFVLDIKAPDGLILAAEYEYNSVHELEGDLHALKLIDLEKEGLGEYRALLSRIGLGAEESRLEFAQSSVAQSVPVQQTVLVQQATPVPTMRTESTRSSTWSGRFEGSDEFLKKIFDILDADSDGRVMLNDTKRTLLVLNQKFNRNYDDVTAINFMDIFDSNKDGSIDFVEFRDSIRAILRL